MKSGPGRYLALVFLGIVGSLLTLPGSALSDGAWVSPSTVAWEVAPHPATLAEMQSRDLHQRPLRAAQARQLGGARLRSRGASRRKLPNGGAAPIPAETSLVATAAALNAPQLAGAGFEGISLADESAAFGTQSFPPDTAAAVGPSHLLELTNGSVAVYTRAGVRQSLVSLDSFFSFNAGGIDYPRGGSFAPRVLYDRKAGRWVAVALEENGGEENDLLLAVSRTSDPTGVWDRYVIDVSAEETFTDFPTLGLDDHGVYVGLNMFGPTYGARIVAVDRSKLYQPTPVLTAYRFDDLTDGFAYQPAHNFDTLGPTDPAWLMAVDAVSLSTLRYRKIVWSGAPALSSDTALAVATTSFPPFVPQAGGSLPIDPGDDRLCNVVVRNGRLWTCQNITFGGRAAVRWYELNTAGGALAVAQYGTIADGTRHYFHPSLAVSGQGHVTVGFSGSSSSEFIGAYYTGRLAGDAAGTMGSVVPLRSGGATYQRLDEDGYNRWGDYSATFVDPNDDQTMWTAQEYATSTAHVWGTRIAPLYAPAPTLASVFATTVPGRNNVVLNLTGTNFFDPGPDFANRLTVAFSGGSPNGITVVNTSVLSPTSIQVTFNVAPNAQLGFRTVTVTNPDGASASVSNALQITNVPPVASDQVLTTNEDTPKPLVLDVVDPDDQELTYTILTPPAHGTLTGTAPNLTYVPAANYHGPDSFIFKANDGVTDSNTATVSITVVSVPDVPIADSQNVTTAEDTPTPITLTASDGDGDPLSYFVLTQPQHGQLSGTAPNLSYTPNPNYHGPDGFTFKVNDGLSDSNVASVSITVTSVNDVPMVTSQSVTTNEDTPVAIVLAASDDDGDALSFTVGNPAHGSLSGTPPNLTYTPAANYHGSDSFTYKVNDGTVDSNVATVSITVVSVPDVPVAASQNLVTPEDTAVPVTLTATDGDGDPLTYLVVSGPAHGSLSGTPPNLTYTPAANYHGPDSFTFKANDGSFDSNTATISITVESVNDVPLASDLNVSTQEDTPVSVVLAATDDDGDALSYIVISGPAHGTLTGTAPTLTYTPAATYYGPDSFTYQASDGTAVSNTATVFITVSSVNDPPIVPANKTVTAVENGPSVPLGITAPTDADGDSLTITVTSVPNPAKGTVRLSDGGAVVAVSQVLSVGELTGLVFSPAPGAAGAAGAFAYTVTDGNGGTASQTVMIQITDVPEPPIAGNMDLSTLEDVPLAFTLDAHDPDEDPLTYTIVTNPLHGTLSGTAPNLVYTPAANYHGLDNFTFRVSDGMFTSNTATVSITVIPDNDPPQVPANKTVTVLEDSPNVPLGIAAPTDADGDPLTITVTAVPAPEKGVVRFAGGGPTVAVSQVLSVGQLTGLEFDPAANASGAAGTFSYTVTDGNGGSASQTITLMITPVNDPPTAAPQDVTTSEDTPVAVPLGAADVDGDPLSYIILTSPEHGILSGTPPNLTYTPAPNYYGPDSFTFKVNDGTVDSNIATVAITILPVPDPPVAYGQDVSVTEDTPRAITLTAEDGDGDALTYQIVVGPSHGTLSGTAPNLTYTPAPNYHGPDSFTFKANDGTTDSNVAVVNITVVAVNDPPIVQADKTITVLENSPNTPLAITAPSDPEGDPLTIVTTAVPNPTKGVVRLAGGGAVVGTGQTLSQGQLLGLEFDPAANQFGPAGTFSYTVSDGQGGTSSQTITFIIEPVNDPPVAANQSVSTNEDTAKAITLSATDPEDDALTYQVVSGPSHGTLTGTAPNLTYIPAADYHGPDSFTFRASDGNSESNTATVSIAVLPVNDPPTVQADRSLTVEEDAAPTALGIAAPNDVDGDPLTIVVTSVPNPSRGLVRLGGGGATVLNGQSLTGAQLTGLEFIPVLNATGSAGTFSYTVSDGNGGTASQSITFTITPVNDAPVAADQAVTTDEDTPRSITLSATDVDGDALTYEVVSYPAHGALTGTAPNLIYTPAADYFGPDSFTFRASDGMANSNTATVSITVNPVYDPPTADSQSVSTKVNTPKAIVLTGASREGHPLTFVAGTPSHGTLSGTVPNLTYTPDADYIGPDSFTFTVFDGVTTSAAATVSITVNPLNEPPVAHSQSVITAEDTPRSITLSGADPDNSPLTYSIVSGPSHGTLSGTAPNVTYTPEKDYHGPDSFSFKVSDGVLESAAAIVSITVTPVNDAPTAQPDSYGVPASVDLNVTAPGVLGNDADPEGDLLSAMLISGPAVGSLTLNPDGSFQYSPPVGFTGPVTFTYRATDGLAQSADTTVTIEVGAAPESTNGAKVNGKGKVVVDEVAVKFKLTATVKKGRAKGNLTFKHPNPNRKVRKAKIEAVVVDGTQARIYGRATLGNRTQVPFVLVVEDRANPGNGMDTFALEFGNGESIPSRTVYGNIKIKVPVKPARR